MTEMVLKTDNEELINYPEIHFRHTLLHTVLDKQFLKYVPLHWHQALQLILVSRGQILVKLPRKELAITEEDGMFINANVVHQIHEIEATSSYICWNMEATSKPVN